jgi:hypothetical protein
MWLSQVRVARVTLQRAIPVQARDRESPSGIRFPSTWRHMSKFTIFRGASVRAEPKVTVVYLEALMRSRHGATPPHPLPSSTREAARPRLCAYVCRDRAGARASEPSANNLPVPRQLGVPWCTAQGVVRSYPGAGLGTVELMACGRAYAKDQGVREDGLLVDLVCA